MAAADAGSRVAAEQDEYEDKVRFFSNYLHNNRPEWQKEIEKCLGNNKYRIPVQLSDLEKQMPGVVNKLMRNPVKYILPWQEALMSFLKDINEKAVRMLKEEIKLDFQGSFGRNHVNPRGINSNTIHNLMCIEGIITKASLSEPKLIQSIHVRKNEDGTVTSRDQRDATAFRDSPNAGAMPTHDADGYELQMEVGMSVYKDQQKFVIQEAPDQAPPGQIPRSVEVICDGDLADKTKPGDRVQVIGVHRGFPPPVTETTNGCWPCRIIATSVELVKEITKSGFVIEDLKHIREIAERDDAFDLLSRSFAPAICGHEKVKAGLLLQLIGGTEKNLDNGTHIRGDINVLMVGDPSCGKSQMLRFVMNTAPNAVSTTGRGSSGVGLTAAMVRDPDTRDFRIEAGAMVLADRGVICIDEFDKMGQPDRVAIHEAMEQQCVTINKAGMHVTLNARASVVAAANPIYGTFDTKKSLAENIGLPDSLLSRFDLVYVVRDNTDEEIDNKIATQVMQQVRYRSPGENRRRGVENIHSSIVERRAQAEDDRSQEATEVFVKDGAAKSVKEVLTVDFLRKYIRFCKQFTPVLSDEAAELVADKYVDLRMRFQSGFSDTRDPNSDRKPRLAVTTRTLEALIRLATAHAKLKLRKDKVETDDVQKAYELMLSAREEEVPKVPGADVVDDGDGADDGADDGAGPGPGKRLKRKTPADATAYGEPAEKVAKGDGKITDRRLKTMLKLVGTTFARAQHIDELEFEDLLMTVNGELLEGEIQFDEAEFNAGLAQMELNNHIVRTETGVAWTG